MSSHAADVDKRHFSRIIFDAPITLQQGERVWESKLVDISLKGVLVVKPDNWDNISEDTLSLSIVLDGDDVEIDMQVKPAHEEDDRIGFHCENIDLDSITTLKRLLELNLGDEDLLSRELSHLLEDN